MHKVQIRRQPLSYEIDELDETLISGALWDNVCGGLQIRVPTISVYGYVDYHILTETNVAISRMHDYGYNQAKICMNRTDNLGIGNEEYEPAYCRFIVRADFNDHSKFPDYKKTKTVAELLKDHPLTRKELMTQLENKGIKANVRREAVNILIKAGYLNIEGSPRGQNSVLSLVDNFPY